jgi:hypothetical protein
LISDLGFNAGVIGAAILVMENFDKENQLITTKQLKYGKNHKKLTTKNTLILN